MMKDVHETKLFFFRLDTTSQTHRTHSHTDFTNFVNESKRIEMDSILGKVKSKDNSQMTMILFPQQICAFKAQPGLKMSTALEMKRESSGCSGSDSLR